MKKQHRLRLAAPKEAGGCSYPDAISISSIMICWTAGGRSSNGGNSNPKPASHAKVQSLPEGISSHAVAAFEFEMNVGAEQDGGVVGSSSAVDRSEWE